MNKERICLVGHDSDDSGGGGGCLGMIITLLIASLVITAIISLMVFGGAFIGGFHSLKNYFISLKHNVIDSNRKPARAN